jgi:hypothetical protein
MTQPPEARREHVTALTVGEQTVTAGETAQEPDAGFVVEMYRDFERAVEAAWKRANLGPAIATTSIPEEVCKGLFKSGYAAALHDTESKDRQKT